MGHFNDAFKLFGAFHDSPEKPEAITLDQLVEQAKRTSFSSPERDLLNEYAKTLSATSSNTTESSIKNRLYLCQIILLQTRDQPRCGKMYRSACDRILPLFSRPEAKLYFLDIARTFYPFWMKASDSPENSNASDGPEF